MAYLNGEWLDREARAERIELVKDLISQYAILADKGEITSYEIEQWEALDAELTKLQRVHRAEVDMLYFFYEYFSEAHNPGNPDNLVPDKNYTSEDAPEFHLKLSRILDSVSNVNTTARICWAASRGHAKSAYLSNAFPVREIVYRKRKMILIISETGSGSKKFVRWASGQLKYNLKIREDFGELLYEQRSRNEKDSEEAFLTTTKIKLEATALGMQIRGFRNGAYRPDLIILDDLESRDSNNTPELRQKAKDWLNQDLIPAGDPNTTAIIFMGTLVHPDSLLNYVLKERKDFIRNKFPAIIKAPERGDLWAEFERIYKEYEPTDEELAEFETATEEVLTPNARAAMDFYYENKTEMDDGIKVLWEYRFPYYALIFEKINLGSKAFNTEFQNNPIDEESQIFKPHLFTYHNDNIDYSDGNYVIGTGIDFAMGKQRGDYSALVTVARHKKTSKTYIIDAFGDRVHPDVFMKIIVDKVAKFQPDKIGAEAQMAQEFFVDKLKEALHITGYPAYTRVKKIQQRTRKELRIEALLPDIENGNIVFSHQHTLLLEQFERYGTGYWDDLPDALEMAINAAKDGKKVLQDKPPWM